jgi:NAD(P)-dependent dehydrogenase (short-subunit alcohol dehydrogenase family)
MTMLTGKTALVTGASRGIGRASALALAAAGAQVLVHYGSGANEAEAVAAEIRKAGGRADVVAADLASADGAHKLARQARAIVGERLDILVANAGVSKNATIEETTVEDFDRLFAVMSGHPSSSCSNCFRSCRTVAALSWSPRLLRTPPLGRCRPMRRPRAPSTRW